MKFHFKKEKCIDCACCNLDELKCYPNDIDCHFEYILEESDLYTPKRCDFFKPKETK